MEGIVSFIILLIFVIITGYCDIRYGKIYNFITLPFLIIALILNIITGGINGLLLSFLGMIIGLLILIIPFYYRWIGGGDVKFLSVCGCILGPKMIIHGTLWGLVIFGVVALIYLIYHRRTKKFFYQLGIKLFNLRTIKGVSIIEVSGKLPMGVFLGIGIIIYWLYFNFY